jgi:hypothetical protein
MLAAVGDIPGTQTDVQYTGDTGDSLLSMQHYRNTVRDFQSTLEALDQGAAAARLALEAADGSGDDSLASDLLDWLGDYDAKGLALRATAQTINAGASLVNAAGGRFPVLSIPAGLGLLPALGIAAIAAIATAATLIAWGNTALRGLNDRLKYAQSLAAVADPAARAKLAEATTMSDSALQTAESSPWAQIATIIKWGAIGLAAFLAYRAFAKRG